MSNTAAARVFGVAELLETILDFLPPPKFGELSDPQLFVLQRVNRTFHDTITGSARLRKRMFELEPNVYRYWLVSEEKAIWTSRILCAHTTRNSKLVRAFVRGFVVRCHSDLASEERIKATAKMSKQGSWRRVKLLKDAAIAPVAVDSPTMDVIIEKFAFAEPGSTLGELLEGEWMNDPRKLLSKTSKAGVHLAVEDYIGWF